MRTPVDDFGDEGIHAAFGERGDGSAGLINLSSPSEYNPFRFEIFSVDEVGHFAVSADLLKVNYVGGGRVRPLKLSVSFPIDAGDLPNILIGFRKLFGVKSQRT